MFKSLLPTDSKIFFSKNDPQDIRLGDLIEPIEADRISQLTSLKNKYAVISYPDDEGISLNGGRLGAKEAPSVIKTFLYKMTPALKKESIDFHFCDVGSISTDQTLNDKHENALKVCHELYQNNYKIISLGGGHDYGYSDGAAFIKASLSKNNSVKPLIINFDAHLDVRPNNHSNHSGTPFYRLKNEFKSSFDLIEVGLQPQCNSIYHWNWALEQNISLLSLNEIEESRWARFYNHPLIDQLTPSTPVMISMDMDAIRSADAGGCSQSWPTGLRLKDVIDCIHFISHKAQLQGLGIYEVAPCFDHDFKTSKAAALLIYNVLFSNALQRN